MTEIALITGANKGIGFATARLLGARGVTVLVGARNPAAGARAADELRAAGVAAHPVPLDVTDGTSVARAAEQIDRERGQLDILVNNAGIARAPGAVRDPDRARPSNTDLAELRMIFETNVFGTVAVTNAMLPLLRRSPRARIVNVSSEVGSIGSMTDPDGPMWPMASVPYPASKAAVNMITAMYAKELRDAGIAVNAANPGYCATDLNERSGFRSPEQGAEVVVHLATLPPDGPTGQLWGHLWRADGTGGYGVLPW